MDILKELLGLFILAIPIACISWTITHEELFKEFIEYCNQCKDAAKSLLKSKFFFLFTCEYCLSHYITLFILFLTGYKLLYDDWRGYIIAFFSLVWIANIYMSLFAKIRLEIKIEKKDASLKEIKLEKEEKS